MSTTTATLHAGLLARKGEARPSASSEPFGAARSGNVSSFADALVRREPMTAAQASSAGKTAVRRIELPRPVVSSPVAKTSTRGRRQVHARVDKELHLRLRIAAARGGRTQQDLVASALEAYLSFLDEDVFSPPCGATNAGV